MAAPLLLVPAIVSFLGSRLVLWTAAAAALGLTAKGVIEAQQSGRVSGAEAQRSLASVIGQALDARVRGDITAADLSALLAAIPGGSSVATRDSGGFDFGSLATPILVGLVVALVVRGFTR